MFRTKVDKSVSGETNICLSPNQKMALVGGVPVGHILQGDASAVVEFSIPVGDSEALGAVERAFLKEIGRGNEYIAKAFDVIRVSWTIGGGWLLPMGAGHGTTTYGAFVKILSGSVGIKSAEYNGEDSVKWESDLGWSLMSYSRLNGDRSKNPSGWPNGVSAGYLFGGNNGLWMSDGAGEVLLALPALVSGVVDCSNPLNWAGFPGFEDGLFHYGVSGV